MLLRLTVPRTQWAGRCRPQATPDFGQSLPQLKQIRHLSPRHDDFEILAGYDHRGVAGSVETPDQVDDIPGQRFLAGMIEGFERLEHRPVEFPEKTKEVLWRTIAEDEMTWLRHDRRCSCAECRIQPTRVPQVAGDLAPAGGGRYLPIVLKSWPMKPSGVQLARPILPPGLVTRSSSAAVRS